MARIRERNGKWQAEIRLKKGQMTETFPEGTTKQQVKEWCLEQERRLKMGDVPTLNRRELERHTLDSLIQWYERDRFMCPHKRKRSYRNEQIMLKAFQQREPRLCRKSFSELTQRDFRDYRDRRLGNDGVKPSTLRRELNPIRHLFRVARLERDIPVENPLQGLWLPPEDPGREPTLSVEERSKLFKATQTCRGVCQRRLWVSLILAALETALRRGQLLKLQWKDVDFVKGILWASPAKKEKRGRWLPLSRSLWTHLELYHSAIPEAQRASNSKVFPITGSAHEQAWRRICKRAGIQDLKFHDLRHIAATSFAAKPVDLLMRENAYMLGHSQGGMTSRYEHLELIESIRAKLDARNDECPPEEKFEILPREQANQLSKWLMKKGLISQERYDRWKAGNSMSKQTQ
jgi:integrase